jgi:hypothetical protein
MGRIYFDDAPDVLGEDMAAIREGVATAAAANAVNQREAEQFLNLYGADVVDGHPDVGQPGRAGDPDIQSDASDV